MQSSWCQEYRRVSWVTDCEVYLDGKSGDLRYRVEKGNVEEL